MSRQNLRALMAERGMTAETLAEACGVTPGAVRHWLCGLRMPGKPTLILAAAALRASPDDVRHAVHLAMRQRRRRMQRA